MFAEVLPELLDLPEREINDIPGDEDTGARTRVISGKRHEHFFIRMVAVRGRNTTETPAFLINPARDVRQPEGIISPAAEKEDAHFSRPFTRTLILPFPTPA